MKWEYMIYLFLGLMFLVFLIDYFIINKRKLTLIENKGKNKKKKQKKIKNIGEIDYLIAKFKLDFKKINMQRAIIWISLINSFIISSVSTIVMFLPIKMMWSMLIAFVLLFALIYSLYEIYGRHLKKLQTKNKKFDK